MTTDATDATETTEFADRSWDELLEDPDAIPGIHFTSREEGRAMFEDMVQQTLGISAEEFFARWDAGEYTPIPDDPEGWKIGSLYMMFPFAGRSLS